MAGSPAALMQFGSVRFWHSDTGEAIEVLALPMSQSGAFLTNDDISKSPGILFGLMWLHAERSKGLASVFPGALATAVDV
jgi:hypothetical protein